MTTEQRLEDLARSMGRRFVEERDRLREQTAALIADVETHKASALVEIERSLRQAQDMLEARMADLKDGEPGPQGPPGQNGHDGADGAPGADGKDGIDGKDGVTPDLDLGPLTLAMMDRLREDRLDLDEHLFAARQRFERLTTEFEERIATLKDGEPGPPGEAGPQGEPGRDGNDGKDGLTGEARGKYDPDAAYGKFDRVSFNGSEWIAKVDDPGPLPGDGWMLGAQGKRGKPGMGIEDMAIDGYALVLAMTGGRMVRLDLRPLFERYHEDSGR